MRRDATGPPAFVLAGVDVLLVGLFSAKDKEFVAKLDLLAASNIVEVYVRRLREKVGRTAIETLRGAGNRLVHDDR